jgi:Chain length determinant protein
MEEKKINSDEIDLLEIFQTLYKQKVIILTITAVFTLVSFIISIVMPKTYVAQAIFEGKYVSISEIQEVIKVYEKAQKLKYKIKIIPLKDSNRGRIEVSGRSQEEAKKNLLHALKIINTELFNIKK